MLLRREYITPRQLAAAIGVSESSLKRWSDQGLLSMTKTAGGHRRLTIAGVVHFLRTTRTPLTNPHVLGLGKEILGPASGDQAIGDAFFDAVRCGERATCISLAIHHYLAGHSVASVCDDVIQPALARLGNAWHRGEADLYEEHRASRICHALLPELRHLLAASKADAQVAIGAAPGGDPYSLATAMAELVLAEHGWRAYDLGPNTPLASLAMAARSEKARIVWVSATHVPDAHALHAELDQLRSECRDRHAILALGGQFFESSPHGQNGADLCAGRSMRDLERLVTAPPQRAMTDAADLIGL